MNQKQNRWGTLLFVLGMCLVSFSAYAVPEGEFATWTGVRVDWQLNPKVKFRGTFQARTQNGLKEMERERLNVGLNYRVLPLLQLKGYYELQHTFIGGTNEAQLRSRLRLAYEPGNWIAYPYFSVEAFQPVGDKAFFSLPRVRYRPGVRWPFSRKTALDVYYCRQYDVKRCLNILGLNLEIKL